MATLVTFHAHPDDEAIATGGTMARAATEGHRVVLVVATNGEHGEVADGFLDDGESLADRRRAETCESARILGAHRVEFLGYRDSGMMGEPTNGNNGSFWTADVDEAARRLAAILEQEAADVLTVYDDHGGYGHPDHIQVHRVGHRAAELAGTPRVYEVTMNRDRIREMQARMRAAADDPSPADDPPDEGRPDVESIGTPDAEITTAVDVIDFIDAKRRAMQAHASQIDEDSWFLSLPDTVYRAAFGTEWYIRTRPGDARPGPDHREGSLFGEASD